MRPHSNWMCASCEGAYECVICKADAAEQPGADGLADNVNNELEYAKSFYCVEHYNQRILEFLIK